MDLIMRIAENQQQRRFGRRWIRRSLFCLGAFVLLLVFFYAEEDWRGRRDWNGYRQAKEAAGEHLDFSAYIRKPVPDEENFATAPIVKSLLRPDFPFFPGLTNDLYAHAALNGISETNITKDKGHRHFVDLVAWQMAWAALHAGKLKGKQHFETDITDLAARAAAAPAVLEGMKTDAAVFEQLRQAGARPLSRFPIQYHSNDFSEIGLNHLQGIHEISHRLSLQACAELAAGQPDKALTDVKLIFSLADSVKSEPFLLSFQVRGGCIQIAVQPVWEGLAEHAWTKEQLQELQSRLQSSNFIADFDQVLKGKRASGIQMVDQFEKYGLGRLDDQFRIYIGAPMNALDRYHKWLDLFGRILPAGWYEEERLNYCAVFDAQMKGTIDVTNARVFPSQVASNYAELTRRLPEDRKSLSSVLHHYAMTGYAPGELRSLPRQVACTQTAANQAAIACALERYRMANGHFPDALDALAPQFISRPPNDVITGRPYKYRRTDDGQFILYSVGWNEKDDGGVPGKTLFDETQGDWVWSYPVR